MLLIEKSGTALTCNNIITMYRLRIIYSQIDSLSISSFALSYMPVVHLEDRVKVCFHNSHVDIKLDSPQWVLAWAKYLETSQVVFYAMKMGELNV